MAMTLNKVNSAMVRMAIASPDFFYFLKNNTTAISDTNYDLIRQNFVDWTDSFNNNNYEIILTNIDNTTTTLSGIGQFPQYPPSR